MSASQSILELSEKQNNCNYAAPVENKNNLQSLRMQEKIALQSIHKLTPEEMVQIDQWLSVLYKTFDELEYPPLYRVLLQATTYFNDELQVCYGTTKDEINPFNPDIFLRSAETRKQIVQSLSLLRSAIKNICVSCFQLSKTCVRHIDSFFAAMRSDFPLNISYDSRCLTRRKNAKYFFFVPHVIYEMTYGIERVNHD